MRQRKQQQQGVPQPPQPIPDASSFADSTTELSYEIKTLASIVATCMIMHYGEHETYEGTAWMFVCFFRELADFCRWHYKVTWVRDAMLPFERIILGFIAFTPSISINSPLTQKIARLELGVIVAFLIAFILSSIRNKFFV